MEPLEEESEGEGEGEEAAQVVEGHSSQYHGVVGVPQEGMAHPLDDVSSPPRMTWRKLAAFVGPGFLVSVGYMDPGNWATDIEGGSRFGYSLIWVLLMSNLMALVLQTLAVRLGLATGRDLAEACREEYPRTVRVALWLLCEVAIAATDLAEVLGTALGLNLLFRLPLLAGVLLTVLDTLLFLAVQSWGIRKLEALVVALLLVIAACFVVEVFLSDPDLMGVLTGFVPTLRYESLYVSIGIIGATVMPHNMYLHSSLVQSRVIARNTRSIREAFFYNTIDTAIALNSAFFVNMAIMIVAAAVFHANGVTVTRVQQAHDLLELLLDSRVAPVMFGLGLLSAGQSSTLTGTLAGQVVMEGFVELHMRPWLRRLVTRTVAIVPAAVVIAAYGDEGTYLLLILSQVVLSVQLPFSVVPLAKFTASPARMGAFASGTPLRRAAWAIAAVITALNLWLVAGMMAEAPAATMPLLVPSCGVLLLLLGYLVWKPVSGGSGVGVMGSGVAAGSSYVALSTAFEGDADTGEGSGEDEAGGEEVTHVVAGPSSARQRSVVSVVVGEGAQGAPPHSLAQQQHQKAPVSAAPSRGTAASSGGSDT